MAEAPRIAIRADASTRIGTGHVRRMRSLASACRAAGAEICFFGRALGVDGARIVGDFRWVTLDAPAVAYDPEPDAPPHAAWAGIRQVDDAAQFATAAAGFDPHWVIVDHYAFDARWHKAVRRNLGSRIAVIDDVADRPLAPDLLVDHNLHADHAVKYAGLLDGDPLLLTGPRHALIDPAFADAPRYAFRERIARIGLFFGGADPGDVTSQVFTALRMEGFTGEIGVVTSSANPNLPALRSRISEDDDATIATDLPDLAGFFADHDMQIGAGGGATWERLCIGTPSILVSLADNQVDVLAPLEAHGVARVLEGAWSSEMICAAVRALDKNPAERRAMSERARAMVDGRGAQRVCAALMCGL